MDEKQGERPKVQIAIGPPRAPGDVGLVSPIAMMVSRADRRWVDAVRNRWGQLPISC